MREIKSRDQESMNADGLAAASSLVPLTYVNQGRDARRTHEKHVQILLEQHKLPDDGWSDQRIRLLLQELSVMDSNNFPENVGVGEREARIASHLVAERHFRLGHGIGRSGDVSAVQPKAAGSSLLNKLTNSLMLDLIRRAGVPSTQSCVLIPVATGMAMMLVLLSLRQQRPEAKYVIWPRIDQKSCFKCIISAGYEAVVVENILEGDELRTDLTGLERAVEQCGASKVVCVLSTTSCFAPRAADRLPDIAKLCARLSVPHVVNNAYGIQSSKCMYLLQEAARVGRVDAFVQSTDKNLMVPVGGAVVASSMSKDFVHQVAQTYPGRASSTPSIDVFITLLSLGWKGYKQLLAERKENYKYLHEQLSIVASTHTETVLHTPNNPISIAMSLTSVSADVDWTELGSMLFIRNVSGTRVVAPGSKKTIGKHTFANWGAHYDGYPCTYLTAAAAIGMKREEVDIFCKRLNKTLTKFKNRHIPHPPSNQEAHTD